MFENNEGLVSRLLKRLWASLSLPLAYVILASKSLGAWIKSVFTRIHLEKLGTPEAGSPILLFAMWEYESVRPDVQRLFSVARDLGFFIVAVNTGKLLGRDAPKNVGVYLEIPNFGRDFASYKAGFRFLYRMNWIQSASRLVMANDSIFYNPRGLKELLLESTNTAKEAFGATENFEIERHLGSFFISLSPRVAAHRKVRRYWNTYRRTDLRSRVIKKGELKFSKTLRQVVPEHRFGAKFSAALVATRLREGGDEALSRFFELTLESPGHRHWKKSRMVAVAEAWLQRHRAALFRNGNAVQLRVSDPSSFHLNAVTLFGIEQELIRLSSETPAEQIWESLRLVATDAALTSVLSGSPIHNSAGVLMDAGLPLVKLDLLYRGAASPGDLQKLQEFMEAREFEEFLDLVLARPFGEDTLRGWKLAAFLRGLI